MITEEELNARAEENWKDFLNEFGTVLNCQKIHDMTIKSYKEGFRKGETMEASK